MTIGIPVYQQHLVYGHTELIDDYCLEEYGLVKHLIHCFNIIQNTECHIKDGSANTWHTCGYYSALGRDSLITTYYNHRNECTYK